MIIKYLIKTRIHNRLTQGSVRRPSEGIASGFQVKYIQKYMKLMSEINGIPFTIYLARDRAVNFSV